MKTYFKKNLTGNICCIQLKLLFSFGIFIIISGLLCAYSQSVSIEELLKNPKVFDSKTVEIEAEAIGEPLKADQGVWVNVTFNGYGLGIFSAEQEAIGKIEHWGSYKETGDFLRIRGVFYKNCPLHQISGIHLKDLKIIKKGEKRKVLVSPSKKKNALILFAVCFMTAIIYFIKRKYARKV